MLKTILFDLDGTLLPIDTDAFAQQYMKLLAAHMGDRIPPATLVEKLLAATYKMIADTDPGRTNAEVFAAHFFPAVGQAEAELMPLFDRFYQERFPALKSVCTGLPGPARRIVQAALDQGYEIVLATNPLFPRIAIEERMRWIDVLDLPWRLVTTYEEMHACKPQPAYYREVLERIGRAPEECLMVGNDLDEDGVASQMGMELFIVTDFLINRSGKPLPPGRSGTLRDLLRKMEAGTFPGKEPRTQTG